MASAPEERISFALTGRSPGLDHRIHAYRDDVADMALAGRVLAHYYAVPVMRRCIVPVANIHEDFIDDATMTSQLLHGECFAVIDQNAGWSWGYCERDHYVGYVRDDTLGAMEEPTHMVIALGDDLPLGSLATTSGPNRAEIGEYVNDPVVIAETLVDIPYLWGGRTSHGIDCSGLVQLAFGLAGHKLPRDSDLQLAALESELPVDAALQRGDIIFFPDHVGIMADETNLVHATQHHGKVVSEPLDVVAARIAENHAEPIIGRKRLG